MSAMRDGERGKKHDFNPPTTPKPGGGEQGGCRGGPLYAGHPGLYVTTHSPILHCPRVAAGSTPSWEEGVAGTN